MSVIKNLFHVSIQADNYEAALEFYCNKLGFEQMFELNIGQFKDMLGMGFHDESDTTPWLTYLRIAPDQYLEMFNGAISPPEFKKCCIPVYQDSPFRYFVLGTEDMNKTCEELERKKIVIKDGFIQDPNGCKIKIVAGKAPEAASKMRLFHSLAGISLYVNDIDKMTEHLEKMTFIKKEYSEKCVCLHIGEFEQYVELVKSSTGVMTRPDDILGHFAVQIYSVTDTVKAWGNNGIYCCPQPFQPDVIVPADDTAKGNIGLDGCEIIWMLCPEGNKIEVMVEPEDTMQQKWERENPF